MGNHTVSNHSSRNTTNSHNNQVTHKRPPLHQLPEASNNKRVARRRREDTLHMPTTSEQGPIQLWEVNNRLGAHTRRQRRPLMVDILLNKRGMVFRHSHMLPQ
jgi:hypothetical protein